MKLTLHDLRLQRLGEPPQPIEGMAPTEYIHLAAYIVLEIDGHTIALEDLDGRWVGVQRFAEKICALRDWLALPHARTELIVDTHAIGGYGLRFLLNDEGVAVTARKNEDRSSALLREVVDREAMFDVLRAFKHQLRSQLAARVSPAAANRTWTRCFSFDIDSDPFV